MLAHSSYPECFKKVNWDYIFMKKEVKINLAHHKDQQNKQRIEFEPNILVK